MAADPQHLDPSADDRFRQFDAVARLLREVCRRSSVVLVLDDLHWADRPTLMLLQHVVRGLTDERLLLIANTRSAGRAGADILGALTAGPRTTVLALSGLATAAIRRQLTPILGEVDERTVGQVRSLTAGNPFFVGEVGRALAFRSINPTAPIVTPGPLSKSARQLSLQ